MANLAKKLLNKTLRKNRVRAKVHGTAVRPRLTVTISNLHVSAQLIDDDKGVTLAAATTIGKKTTGTLTEKAAGVGADEVVVEAEGNALQQVAEGHAEDQRRYPTADE